MKIIIIALSLLINTNALADSLFNSPNEQYKQDTKDLKSAMEPGQSPSLFKDINTGKVGHYDSRVPGGNVFLFCSSPKPPKKDPNREVWDNICPAGK